MWNASLQEKSKDKKKEKGKDKEKEKVSRWQALREDIAEPVGRLTLQEVNMLGFCCATVDGGNLARLLEWTC